MPDKRVMLTIAKDLRKHMTQQEKHLWYDFLQKYPLKIYKQKPIDRFVLDFYCPKAKLAVEIDGGQHYTQDGLSRDEERTYMINCYGIEVIRFTNKEIAMDFESVCGKIDDEIQSRVALSDLHPRCKWGEASPPLRGTSPSRRRGCSWFYGNYDTQK